MNLASPASVAHIVQYFERLSRADLARLDEIYAPQARFKDPFHEVVGVAAIAQVYARMFDKLQTPRFVVLDALAQGPQCFLRWDFHFCFRASTVAQKLHGASYLELDEHGRIVLHRDYWDAAEELYEKLPLLGGFMRWLKKRAA